MRLRSGIARAIRISRLCGRSCVLPDPMRIRSVRIVGWGIRLRGDAMPFAHAVAFARHSRESGNPVSWLLPHKLKATAKSLDDRTFVRGKDARFRGNRE